MKRNSHPLLRCCSLLLLILAMPQPLLAGTVTAYKGYGTVDGKRFATPSGIVVDSDGTIVVSDSNNHAIKAFTEMGKAVLAIANGQGSGSAQFNTPGGMTRDGQGNLWVADYNNHRLQKFTAAGVYANVAVGSNGSAGDAANRLHPYHVKLGPDGNYWLAEYDRHRVVAVSPEGKQLKVVGTSTSGSADGQFYNPAALDFDSQGNLWVVEYYNHRLQKFNANGDFVSKFGSSGSTSGQVISTPRAVFPTGDGVLVAESNRVVKIGLDGLPLFTLGNAGGTSGSALGQFSTPAGIAVDGQGQIYVADSGNSRIQVFTAAGVFIKAFGGYSGGASTSKTVFEAGELYEPYDLEFDAQGKLWVSDIYKHVVQRFTADGVYDGGFDGSSDATGGKFVTPHHLTCDSQGNLWVTDSPKRVRQYKPDGSYLQTVDTFTVGGQAGTLYSNTPGDVVAVGNTLWVADYGTTRLLAIDLTTKSAQAYSGFSSPWGMARDSAGALWISDNSNGRVVQMAGSGLVIRAFSENAAKGEVLNYPLGMAVDTADGVWVADSSNHRLLHYNAAGALTLKIGGYKSKLLSSPRQIARANDGSVWVADYDNAAVYHFAADGACLGKIDNTTQAAVTMGGLLGVALYSDTATPPVEYVVVSDYDKDQVLKFKSDGTFVAALGDSGSGAALNKYNNPYALAMANGELLVADYGNSRLKVLSPDGAYRRAYTTNGVADWGYLNLPADVAYNAKTKTLWVTDSANSRLRVLDEAGNFVKTIGGPGCGLYANPHWLHADAVSGHVWVTDLDNDQVSELDSEGNLVATLGSAQSTPTFSGPTGAAALADGSLWATDKGHHRVVHLKADGTAITVLGTGVSGSGNDQFKNPEGVLQAGTTLYVADTANGRIQKFTGQGVWQQTIGAPGANLGALNGPTAMEVDSQGRLWVVERGNNRLQVFAADGTALFTVGDSQLFQAPAGGLAIDQAGKVWVADTGNNRVLQLEVATDGTATTLLALGKADKGYGSNAGEFNQPHGIAIDSQGNIQVADSGNNRVQVFTPDGAFVRAYGGLSAPMGLAIAGGKVTVADSGNSRMALFGENGAFVTAFADNGSGETGFTDPKGVARDSKGNLWVADAGSDRVMQFNAGGTLLQKVSQLLDGPCEIAVDQADNLWVVSKGNSRVVKYSAAGALLKVFDNGGETFSQLNNPADMLFYQGNLYLVDRGNHRIVVQDSQGATLRTFGVYGDAPGLLYDPWGITVGPDNNIWVSQTYNEKITVFTPSGDFVKSFGSYGSLAGMLNDPHGLAFGTEGNLWVVNTAAHRLDLFSAGGGYLKSIGGSGSGQGQLSSPQDVAIDAQGHLYVSDYGNSRLAVFDGAGNFLYTFGESYLSYPGGLALDSHGVLWVLDSSKDKIFAFSPQGDLLFQGSGNGTGLGQLQNPSGLAVDAVDNVWVGDDYSSTDKLQAFTLNAPTGLNLTLRHRHWRAGMEADHLVDVVPGAVVMPQVQGTVALGTSSGSGDLKTLLAASWSSNNPQVATVTADGVITALAVGQAQVQAQVGSETLGLTVNVVADDALAVMVLGSKGADQDQYAAPSVLFAAGDKVFVADHDNKRIKALDLAGNTVWSFHNPDYLSNINGLLVDGAGNLLVSDSSTQQVHKFDANGNHLLAIGLGGSGSLAGQFKTPSGLALDGNGNLWVADFYNHRLQQFNATTGAYVGGFGTSGAADSNLYYPTDVAVAADGTLWVADNSKLKHFSADGGTVLGVSTNISPRRLWLDAAANLWVLCSDQTIRKFAPDLTPLMNYNYLADTSGNDDPPGTMDNPQGVAMDGKGNLWVAEWDNHRLQRIRFITQGLTLATAKGVVLDSQQVNAIATYGVTTDVMPTEVVNSPALWSLDVPAMATIDHGALSALKTGTVTVSAAFDGFSDALTLDLLKQSALEVMPNNALDKAMPIDEAKAVKGNVSSSEQDWFTFTTSVAGYYTILFSSSLPTSNISINVVDGAGKTIYTAGSTTALAAPIFLEGQTAYYLKLVGYTANENYLVSYTLSSAGEPSTPATSSDLLLGQTATGLAAINSGAYYRLQLDGPRQLLIDYSNPGSTTTMEITIYPEEISDETVLDRLTSTKGAAAQIAIGLNQGTYYVRLMPSGNVDKGQYSFTVSPNTLATAGEYEPNNTKPFTNTLANGQALTARNYSSKDADFYTFHYAPEKESDFLTLDFTPQDSKGSHTITLLNLEDDTPIKTFTAASGTAIVGQEFNLKPGQYFLKVKDSSSNRTEYQLTVNGKISPVKKVVGVSLAAETPLEALKVGDSLTLDATVYFSDGSTQENPAGLVWSCTAPIEGMTISNAGVLNVLKASSGSVVASFDGKVAMLDLSVGVVKKQSFGNLIIVAGGGIAPSNQLKGITQYLSDLAYQKFKGRGFGDGDIYYFNPIAFKDLDGNGFNDGIVDQTEITKAGFTEAISNWATAYPSTGPLYIYLNDHGANAQFQLFPNQILTASMLKSALDAFQDTTQRAVVVIIEACHSGTFVEPLMAGATNRVVITSADQGVAFLGDGGSASFSQFFMGSLYKGASLSEAYTAANQALAALGSPYATMYPQVAPATLAATAQDFHVVGNFALAPMFPEITQTQLAATYDAAGGSGYTIQAKVTGVDNGKVWATVKPVNYTPPAVSGEFATPDIQLPMVDLLDADQEGAMDEVFNGTYAGFTGNGDYDVVIFARDSEGNITQTAVHKLTVTGLATANDYLNAGTGWSLLSSLIPFQVAEHLADQQKFTSAWKWESGSWAVYLAGEEQPGAYAASKGFTTLTAINPGEGFWVNSKSDQQLTITGTPVPGELTFTPGWNLLGLKGSQANSVDQLINGQSGIVSIWKWVVSGGQGIWAVYLASEGATQGAYAASKGFAILSTINPGEGFWVNKNE